MPVPVTRKVIVRFRVFCNPADKPGFAPRIAEWMANAASVFAQIGIRPEAPFQTKFYTNPVHFAEWVGLSRVTQDAAIGRRAAAYRNDAGAADICAYVVDIVEAFQGLATQNSPDLLLDQSACERDLAHEIGHVLGLADTSAQHEIMYSSPCSALAPWGFSLVQANWVAGSPLLKPI